MNQRFTLLVLNAAFASWVHVMNAGYLASGCRADQQQYQALEFQQRLITHPVLSHYPCSASPMRGALYLGIHGLVPLNPAVLYAAGDWHIMYFMLGSYLSLLLFVLRQRLLMRWWSAICAAQRVGICNAYLVALWHGHVTGTTFPGALLHMQQRQRSGLSFLTVAAAAMFRASPKVEAWLGPLTALCTVACCWAHDKYMESRVPMVPLLGVREVILHFLSAGLLPWLVACWLEGGGRDAAAARRAAAAGATEASASTMHHHLLMPLSPTAKKKASASSAAASGACSSSSNSSGCAEEHVPCCSTAGLSMQKHVQQQQPLQQAQEHIHQAQQTAKGFESCAISTTAVVKAGGPLVNSASNGPCTHSTTSATAAAALQEPASGHSAALGSSCSDSSNSSSNNGSSIPTSSDAVLAEKQMTAPTTQHSVKEPAPQPVPLRVLTSAQALAPVSISSAAQGQLIQLPQLLEQSLAHAQANTGSCMGSNPQQYSGRKPASALYRSRALNRRMTIKVHDHQLSYAVAKEALMPVVFNAVAQQLHSSGPGQQGGAWYPHVAAAPGCVQLFLWVHTSVQGDAAQQEALLRELLTVAANTALRDAALPGSMRAAMVEVQCWGAAADNEDPTMQATAYWLANRDSSGAEAAGLQQGVVNSRFTVARRPHAQQQQPSLTPTPASALQPSSTDTAPATNVRLLCMQPVCISAGADMQDVAVDLWVQVISVQPHNTMQLIPSSPTTSEPSLPNSSSASTTVSSSESVPTYDSTSVPVRVLVMGPSNELLVDEVHSLEPQTDQAQRIRLAIPVTDELLGSLSDCQAAGLQVVLARPLLSPAIPDLIIAAGQACPGLATGGNDRQLSPSPMVYGSATLLVASTGIAAELTRVWTLMLQEAAEQAAADTAAPTVGDASSSGAAGSSNSAYTGMPQQQQQQPTAQDTTLAIAWQHMQYLQNDISALLGIAAEQRSMPGVPSSNTGEPGSSTYSRTAAQLLVADLLPHVLQFTANFNMPEVASMLHCAFPTYTQQQQQHVPPPATQTVPAAAAATLTTAAATGSSERVNIPPAPQMPQSSSSAPPAGQEPARTSASSAQNEQGHATISSSSTAAADAAQQPSTSTSAPVHMADLHLHDQHKQAGTAAVQQNQAGDFQQQRQYNQEPRPRTAALHAQHDSITALWPGLQLAVYGFEDQDMERQYVQHRVRYLHVTEWATLVQLVAITVYYTILNSRIGYMLVVELLTWAAAWIIGHSVFLLGSSLKTRFLALVAAYVVEGGWWILNGFNIMPTPPFVRSLGCSRTAPLMYSLLRLLQSQVSVPEWLVLDGINRVSYLFLIFGPLSSSCGADHHRLQWGLVRHLLGGYLVTALLSVLLDIRNRRQFMVGQQRQQQQGQEPAHAQQQQQQNGREQHTGKQPVGAADGKLCNGVDALAAGEAGPSTSHWHKKTQ